MFAVPIILFSFFSLQLLFWLMTFLWFLVVVVVVVSEMQYDFVFLFFAVCFFLSYALVFFNVYCRVLPDVLQSLMFFHVPPLGFLEKKKKLLLLVCISSQSRGPQH